MCGTSTESRSIPTSGNEIMLPWPLHAACGFTQVLDYAKLIDGSVNTSHVTLKCL